MGGDIGQGIGQMVVFFAVLAAFGTCFAIGAIIGLILMFSGFTNAGAIVATIGAVLGVIAACFVVRAA